MVANTEWALEAFTDEDDFLKGWWPLTDASDHEIRKVLSLSEDIIGLLEISKEQASLLSEEFNLRITLKDYTSFFIGKWEVSD